MGSAKCCRRERTPWDGVCQHPAPPSTPHAGQEVQRESAAQQPGPTHWRRRLLLRFRLRRCLRRWARLLWLRPCPRVGDRWRPCGQHAIPAKGGGNVPLWGTPVPPRAPKGWGPFVAQPSPEAEALRGSALSATALSCASASAGPSTSCLPANLFTMAPFHPGRNEKFHPKVRWLDRRRRPCAGGNTGGRVEQPELRPRAGRCPKRHNRSELTPSGYPHRASKEGERHEKRHAHPVQEGLRSV
jgi:hypothetical protein